MMIWGYPAKKIVPPGSSPATRAVNPFTAPPAACWLLDNMTNSSPSSLHGAFHRLHREILQFGFSIFTSGTFGWIWGVTEIHYAQPKHRLC